ncbi:MAG: Modification methylase AplI [Syntrophomonadaceae bacterium]|nr:Modification methylase AplI [Bacillota bacterium]
MFSSIPVIDVFAGPGGLGEGFASFRDGVGKTPFAIRLSIEKDHFAHKTLELRSFFRQFSDKNVPDDYYEYLRGNIQREELFKKYPVQAQNAEREVWCAELGDKGISRQEVDVLIKEALSGSKKWLLIGGPPCQAYSLVGRSRMKKVNSEEFENDHRHFLYREYLNIIAVHGPPVFVMENVPGILSSRVNGENIFERILHDIRNPTDAVLELNSSTERPDERFTYHIYSLVKSTDDAHNLKPSEYVIRSEDYGIPQARHRVILLGIRSDLDVKPLQLSKAGEKVPMWNAISDLPALRSRLSKEKDSWESWKAILESVSKCEWFSDPSIDDALRDKLRSVSKENNGILDIGREFTPCSENPDIFPEWFRDERLGGVNHHLSRSHIRKDLYRYLFASCFAKVHGRSPRLRDFPESLLPDHKNVGKAVNGGMFSDRFRVQVKGEPSTTITSHISKDGHYYIHPDPTQSRSLTVREAARLQTFPDNYLFEGPRTMQYHQIGNAVPPLLARQIAEVVYCAFCQYR